MAHIQRRISRLTGEVTYRAHVRRKGRSAETAIFPNRKEAKEWAASIESAIRENRYFPHAAAKRTSFDALALDYASTVLSDFDPKEKATRERQLKWWSEQFSGLSLADITPDRVSQARDRLAAEARPAWAAFDIRMMFQGYLERGFVAEDGDAAIFTKLLGHEPRAYDDFANETMHEWQTLANPRVAA